MTSYYAPRISNAGWAAEKKHSPVSLMTERKKPTKTYKRQGFTIVEVVIASVILFTSVTVAVTLFNFTNTNARLGEKKQGEQTAISEDLAQVIRLNDQYKCASSNDCSSNNSYPNENEYISSNQAELDSICTTDKDTQGYPGQGFAPRLVEEINQLSTPLRLKELGITRTATIIQNNSLGSPPHLYSVEWLDAAGTSLRQVTLFPTVAAWCP